MSKKKKFYVVWEGVKSGIYQSWEECKAQVFGFENARYKSFTSLHEAEKAFTDNPWKHLKSKNAGKTKKNLSSNSKIIQDSIAVDAACSGNPGLMEFRGVYVADGSQIFHHGPLEDGTNNIGEFLAIVFALAWMNRDNKLLPIYSDSANAIIWVNKKKCNTKLKQTEKNKEIFVLIERAEKWLNTHSYSNQILKWETKLWGEIPADFGRK